MTAQSTVYTSPTGGYLPISRIGHNGVMVTTEGPECQSKLEASRVAQETTAQMWRQAKTAEGKK